MGEELIIFSWLTNSKVHEVVTAEAGFIEDLLQHALINFVGDVAKHDLCQWSEEARQEGGDQLTVVRTSSPA